MWSRSFVCSTTFRNDSVVRTTIALQVVQSSHACARRSVERSSYYTNTVRDVGHRSFRKATCLPTPLAPREISRMYTSQTRLCRPPYSHPFLLGMISHFGIPNYRNRLHVYPSPSSCALSPLPNPKNPKLNYRTSEHQPYAAVRCSSHATDHPLAFTLTNN